MFIEVGILKKQIMKSDFCKVIGVVLNLLNLVGGKKKRTEYISYNQPDDSHGVLLAYDYSASVGCVTFKKYDYECAEVKRAFFNP